MTFNLSITPFPLLDKVIREMRPMDSFVMTYTSIKMYEYIAAVDLRKVAVDIFHSRATTVINFETDIRQSIVIGEVPGECPFKAAGTCDLGGEHMYTDAPLEVVLNVLFKVLKVGVRRLKIQMNAENQYDELSTGFEALREKRCEHLQLTTNFFPNGALEPPAFLDGFSIGYLDLYLKLTRLPHATMETISFGFMEVDKMIEFYQQWKTSSMDHLKNVTFSSNQPLGEFFEIVGALEQEDRMEVVDENGFNDDDNFDEFWEMERDNGDIVELKMGCKSVYASVKSN